MKHFNPKKVLSIRQKVLEVSLYKKEKPFHLIIVKVKVQETKNLNWLMSNTRALKVDLINFKKEISYQMMRI